jgi:hypothetical protein
LLRSLDLSHVLHKAYYREDEEAELEAALRGIECANPRQQDGLIDVLVQVIEGMDLAISTLLPPREKLKQTPIS